MDTNTIFLTTASANSEPAVRLMIDSLRAFGGELAETPCWVFASKPDLVPAFIDKHTDILPLMVSDSLTGFPFGIKVTACARAEALAPAGMNSLVWIDPSCIVIQPPILFELGVDCDAAFRPVHIRNVGLSPGEPLDEFWKGIVAAVGVDDIQTTVTSFVDGQLLRSYFNSHAFAINPALGLMQRWEELFRQLVGDRSFQSSACTDEPHQVFLFQALLSTLFATSVDPARLRILPPDYNYPYNLQDRIPSDRRLAVLNETVCFTYEDRPIHPAEVTGIEVHEPLRAWLAAHAPES